MKIESLAEVRVAFETWRRGKRHQREAIPAELLERARAVAQREGPAAVARATRIDRARLKTGSRAGSGGCTVGTPGFSRVTLAAPVGQPFAEVEGPTGVRVRLFTPTDQALRLLTTLLGAGVAR